MYRIIKIDRYKGGVVMLELAFMVCLRLAATECEERTIAMLPEVGIMGCMMQAQPELARWSEVHPNLTINRWSCRPANPLGKA